MLLHRRLGHPSFWYLKHLFPSLFRNNDSFCCEVCQLAKHKRITFQPQPHRGSKPLFVIHSDIWGPSRIRSLTNKRQFITFIEDHTCVSRWDPCPSHLLTCLPIFSTYLHCDLEEKNPRRAARTPTSSSF